MKETRSKIQEFLLETLGLEDKRGKKQEIRIFIATLGLKDERGNNFGFLRLEEKLITNSQFTQSLTASLKKFLWLLNKVQLTRVIL